MSQFSDEPSLRQATKSGDAASGINKPEKLTKKCTAVGGMHRKKHWGEVSRTAQGLPIGVLPLRQPVGRHGHRQLKNFKAG
jgi:hypothetical protein